MAQLEAAGNPENTIEKIFSFAPVWRRVVARIIDWIIVFFLVALLSNFILIFDSSYEDSSRQIFETAGVNYVDKIQTCLQNEDIQTASCQQVENVYRKTMPAYYISTIIVSLFYFVLFVVRPKQATLGKILLKIKLLSKNGESLTVSQAFLRHLPWTILNLIGLFGFINYYTSFISLPINSVIAAGLNIVVLAQIQLTIFKQGLHDNIANTVVIMEDNMIDKLRISPLTKIDKEAQ